MVKDRLKQLALDCGEQNIDGKKKVLRTVYQNTEGEQPILRYPHTAHMQLCTQCNE